MLEQDVQSTLDLSNFKVYENTDCCICLDEIVIGYIFYRCGHYCCCKDCSTKLSTCPLCRQNIESFITREELQ